MDFTSGPAAWNSSTGTATDVLLVRRRFVEGRLNCPSRPGGFVQRTGNASGSGTGTRASSSVDGDDGRCTGRDDGLSLDAMVELTSEM